MKKVLIGILAIWMMVALGCAPETADTAAAVQTPEAVQTPAPTATPAPTPIETTTPEQTPIETTAPDVEPTAPPTPEPTPVLPEGSVAVADGFYYRPLDDAIKARITGISYPADDDDMAITYDDLAYIRLLYCDFDGEVHKGEMIVNKQLAQEVTEIFYALYQAEYPLASVRLVSDYGEPANDTASMTDNNTSAFCYRRVTGSKSLSRHSFGAAIDINPVMNPYINGDRFSPKNSEPYLDRSQNLPGMIDHDDLAYQLLTERGWTWGGDWSGDKDYQHFSKDIGY